MSADKTSSDQQPPKPDDIQKEFEDFVRRRFGDQAKVVTRAVPLSFQDSPQTEAQTEEPDDGTEDIFERIRSFDMRPDQIKAYLDRFVIRQDEAKKALAIAVCDHYNQVKRHLNDTASDAYAKQNVLLLGPTGVGKTYLVRQIAKLIGVPFVKADATRFSETGYVGSNVDDLIRDLVAQADGNRELAEFGIIYLDEADKLAAPTGHGSRDVSGRGVQFGLLKLMEETDVDLSGGNDIRSQMEAFMDFQSRGKSKRKVVNTRNILFIVSGAFHGLDELISDRTNRNDIGFSASIDRHDDEVDLFAQATTKDFVDYGFEPEFIGRLPVRVACHHLHSGDLRDILANSEGSILRQYEDAFAAYGINAHFTEKALEEIAKQAENQKTGARALMTVLEKALRHYKYELPAHKIRDLVVTDAIIRQPDTELRDLIDNPNYVQRMAQRQGCQRFEEEFFTRHGMRLLFSEQAIDTLVELATAREESVVDFCRGHFKSYEHGLNLIQQNTGQSEFKLGKSAVDDPKKTLEQLIQASYAEKPGEEPTPGDQ